MPSPAGSPGKCKTHADVWQRLYNGALEREKKIYEREKSLHVTAFACPTLKRDKSSTPRYIMLYAVAMRKIKINNEFRKAKALNAVKESNRSIKTNHSTNERCNMLYDLSHEKHMIGKKRRESICRKNAIANNLKNMYRLNTPKKKASHQCTSINKSQYPKYALSYSRLSPIYEEYVRERDKNMHRKLSPDITHSALMSNADHSVLNDASKRYQRRREKSRERNYKSETRKGKSNALNHPKYKVPNSNVGLSSRILYLYESGKQKIRMKRDPRALCRISTTTRRRDEIRAQ